MDIPIIAFGYFVCELCSYRKHKWYFICVDHPYTPNSVFSCTCCFPLITGLLVVFHPNFSSQHYHWIVAVGDHHDGRAFKNLLQQMGMSFAEMLFPLLKREQTSPNVYW